MPEQDATNPAPIRVAHTTENVSRLGYGVSEVLWGFAEHARERGVVPSVVGVDDPCVRDTAAEHPGVDIRTAPQRGPRVLGWSPGAERLLMEIPDLDLIHMHGMWTMIGRHARRAARRRGIPLVISAHGMLEPSARSHRAWKKSIARALWESANIRSAAVIHCTALREARHVRACGVDRPLAIIGNAIDPALYTTEPDRARIEAKWPELRGTRIVLFFGRIHPIKGVVHLADAWGRIASEHPDAHLVIAGPDEGGHRASIEHRLRDAGAAHRVTFTGPVYAEDKKHLLAAADLCVQPSISENFGITIIESLVSGAPVLTTTGTPWEELEQRGCGAQVDIGVREGASPVAAEAIGAGLRRFLALPSAQLRDMGMLGRELVLEKYTWSAATDRLVGLYRWVLGSGESLPCLIPEREPVPFTPS